jgi:2-methylisocitrate lyase-like PEP mutase family enzyme
MSQSETARAERVARFHALHTPRLPLLLANAWDAASARIFELAGAPAVATTSAGIAVTLGFPDGNYLPRALAIEALRRIVAAVGAPVSADVEAGYGTTPAEVCETIRAVIDAGAVGINIEDGTGEPAVLVAKLEGIRELTRSAGTPLFVNARTDTYLNGQLAPPDALAESLRRAALYTAAGADGIFVPAVVDPEAIRTLTGELRLPLNVLAVPRLPAPAALGQLGVARISAGSGPMRAALTTARAVATAFYDDGAYAPFLDGVITHAETNAIMGARGA